VRRLLRVLVIVATVLATLVLILAGTAVYVVRDAFPSYDGSVDLPGLSADVEVVRDENGIAQIYADTTADLFAAQGYLHAQDRFFEMDFRRHVTSGRLAEMFGEDALEADEFVRTLGWRRIAEQELALVTPATRRALDAYATGVNAYLDNHQGSKLSLEYAVLGLNGLDYRAEPWTAADSLAWLKAMAWDLRGNMDEEIERVRLAATRTPAQIAELFPKYPYDRNEPIVPSSTVAQGKFVGTAPEVSRAAFSPALLAELKRIEKVSAKLPQLMGRGDGIGSNSWVVSGEHTKSGKPLLANDPHLSPSMPGIWEQMGLHCRRVGTACPFDVSGFTFSGVPGVVIGHNDEIAWGFTNLDPDVTDLYLEKVRGNATVYGKRTEPLKVRTETFRVAGRDEPVTITVRDSLHGPLISDVSEDQRTVGRLAAEAGPQAAARTGGERYAVALRWTALSPGRTADALFAMNKARGWQAFRDAAKLFEVPAQNLVYADRSGHIGYQAPGRIPIRGKGTGDWPAPGWDPSYEWKGYIPFAALPYEFDPPDGIIATANQAVVPADYPYHLSTTWDYGYRSQQIADRLAAGGKLDPAAMTRIQFDDLNRNAAMLVPHLLRIKIGDPWVREGQDTLRGWNFRQPAASSAAAYFNVVWRDVLALTFHDQLPEETWPDGGSRWFEVVRNLVAQPDSEWWDDVNTKEKRETRDDILRKALVNARDEITVAMARDPKYWQWGRLHTLTLTNQTLGKSGIGPVERLFNRGPYQLGGGPSVVDATGWNAAEGYEVDAVPSMRMVVDLSDLDRSRWINLTGVSGHAFDDHYVDQTPLWATGRTLPWPYTRESVDSHREHTLTLHPAS
jgi:penicillin amidase